MKHFTIYNQEGIILHSGQVSDEDFDLQILQPGENIIEAQSDPKLDMVDPISKQVLPGAKPQVTPEVLAKLPEYVTARTNSYPSVQEQLDMLWHAMDTGQAAKAEPFYSTIKAVKDTYPKDAANTDATLLYNLG